MEFDELDRRQVAWEYFRIGIPYARERRDIQFLSDQFTNLVFRFLGLVPGIQWELIQPGLNGSEKVFFCT